MFWRTETAGLDPTQTGTVPSGHTCVISSEGGCIEVDEDPGGPVPAGVTEVEVLLGPVVLVVLYDVGVSAQVVEDQSHALVVLTRRRRLVWKRREIRKHGREMLRKGGTFAETHR